MISHSPIFFDLLVIITMIQDSLFLRKRRRRRRERERERECVVYSTRASCSAISVCVCVIHISQLWTCLKNG